VRSTRRSLRFSFIATSFQDIAGSVFGTERTVGFVAGAAPARVPQSNNQPESYTHPDSGVELTMSLQSAASAAVELREVTRVYDTPSGPLRALDGANLRIDPGELVAVVGRSGSGKSTLLNLIAGIDRATFGSVHVAGTDVTRLGERRLAAWRGRNVGVVFQFFQLLPTLTVAENVALPMDFCGHGPRAQRDARARALLERVEISDQADKLPLALSGGQQQRAAIARALANDPAVVVADEPTGNLDSKSGAAVWALFAELAREGKAVIVVTHDPEVSRWAQRVVQIADGQVAAHA
jgi:putative ABC transport system ATP-binding protein